MGPPGLEKSPAFNAHPEPNPRAKPTPSGTSDPLCPGQLCLCLTPPFHEEFSPITTKPQIPQSRREKPRGMGRGKFLFPLQDKVCAATLLVPRAAEIRCAERILLSSSRLPTVQHSLQASHRKLDIMQLTQNILYFSPANGNSSKLW